MDSTEKVQTMKCITSVEWNLWGMGGGVLTLGTWSSSKKERKKSNKPLDHNEQLSSLWTKKKIKKSWICKPTGPTLLIHLSDTSGAKPWYNDHSFFSRDLWHLARDTQSLVHHERREKGSTSQMINWKSSRSEEIFAQRSPNKQSTGKQRELAC